MVLDKTIGAIIIVASIIWHLYYTIWILVTPWLETSQDLAHWLKYFPDRYYGLAIPALLLAFIIDLPTCPVFPNNNILDIEKGFDKEVIYELKSRGHKINYPSLPIGGGQMILIDEETDVLIGASDWRKDGLAIGY